MKKLQPFEILRNKQREINEEIRAMDDDAQPVCDGVADDAALKFPPLKGSEWRRKGSFDGVYRFGDKDTFVIDACHPGRKGLTYANDLIGVLQQIHSKL